MSSVFVYDPTANDPLSKVRGVGRYLQILKENFPGWVFINNLAPLRSSSYEGQATFINPFFNFLQTPLTLKRIARKQIAVIHDLIPLKYPEHFPVGIRGKLNIFLNKLALRNYDLIITDSETSKKDIIDILYINKDKIKVIYPCLPKIFNQEERIKKQELSKNNSSYYSLLTSNFCLYVGDATWNKNLVNLAKAIKLINVTCVFVGKVFNPTMKQSNNESIKNNLLDHPWNTELSQFLKETAGDKRFIFLGYVQDEQLIQLYCKAKCNILVSRDEGFGFSYLEAASQSCPSVLADIIVLHEVSNDQGALFAKPQDTNDIANTVGEIYFNRDLRNKLGNQAKNWVEFFSTNNLVKQFNFLTKL